MWCGKDFCIAAPWEYKWESGGIITTLGGTSGAAAAVSGVAAAIKGKYDWMDGANLRDVLVTTTDEAGVLGVDPIYGQGIMNAERALKGYGRFDQETILNVGGIREAYSFDNPISGDGSLIKNGSKTLIFSNNTTYKGGTTINNGALRLQGTNSSAMTVKSGGALEIDGQKVSTGSVDNQGVLSVLSDGIYNINGDLNSSGTIHTVLDNTITVSGNANLSGNFNLLGSGNKTYHISAQGITETLLTADKLDVGNLNFTYSINSSNLLSYNFSYDDQSIQTTITRDSVSNAIYATNTLRFAGITEVAEDLDLVFANYDAILANDGALSAAQESFAVALLNSTNLTQTLHENSSYYLKNATENANFSALRQNQRFIQNALKEEGHGVWVDYQHQQANLALSGLSGKAHENGVRVGMRFPVHENHALAMSFGENRMNWNERFASSTQQLEIDAKGFDLAYLTRFGDYNAYVQAGYDWLNYDNDWDKSSGKQYSFGFGINKNFNFSDGLRLRPEISLQHIRTYLRDFAINSYVRSQNLDSRAWVAGLNLTGYLDLNNLWQLQMGAGIDYDLNQKTKWQNNYLGESYGQSESAMGNTRAYTSLGLGYRNNGFGLAFVGAYEKSAHWSNRSANLTLSYLF